MTRVNVSAVTTTITTTTAAAAAATTTTTTTATAFEFFHKPRNSVLWPAMLLVDACSGL